MKWWVIKDFTRMYDFWFNRKRKLYNIRLTLILSKENPQFERNIIISCFSLEVVYLTNFFTVVAPNCYDKMTLSYITIAIFKICLVFDNHWVNRSWCSIKYSSRILWIIIELQHIDFHTLPTQSYVGNIIYDAWGIQKRFSVPERHLRLNKIHEY